jgi:hypothetical protein
MHAAPGVDKVNSVDSVDRRPQVVGHRAVSAPEGNVGVPSRRGAVRQSLFDAAVIVGYVLLGLVAYWPLRPWSSTRLFGAGTTDPVVATWFLAWVPHALAHGTNPLFSNALFAPLGLNVAQNTSSPVLGVLTGLLAPLLSPIQRGNLLMMLAMPVSASAAYVVLRKWAVWTPAAAIGALVYGFSPFQIGHGLGHLNLVFLPLPPLIAYTMASIINRRGSPRRLGFQLGLLLAAQFLVSAEILVMCVILSALVLGSVAVAHWARAVEQSRVLLKPLAIGAVVTGLIIALPVWMIVFGPRHYTGPVHPVPSDHYVDLLSPIHSGPLQRFSLGIPPLHVDPNGAENTGYIGILLLVVAIWLGWRSRRAPRMQVAVLLTAWAYILSLGAHLSVEGHLSRIPLPFDAFSRLPLFDNMLPGRFSFATALGLGAVIAFGLDDLRRPPGEGRLRDRHGTPRHIVWAQHRAAVACVVVLLALVVSQLPRWPYLSQRVRQLPTQITAAIPKGNPVAVTYPYPSWRNAEAEIWQMQDGFSFRLIGGYAFQPSATGRASLEPNPTNPPGLSTYLQNLWQRVETPPTEALVISTRAALANYDVRLVIVDLGMPGGPLAFTLFERTLGSPKVRSGLFALWSNGQNAL